MIKTTNAVTVRLQLLLAGVLLSQATIRFPKGVFKTLYEVKGIRNIEYQGRVQLLDDITYQLELRDANPMVLYMFQEPGNPTVDYWFPVVKECDEAKVKIFDWEHLNHPMETIAKVLEFEELILP